MGYVAGKRLKWGDGFIEIGEPVPDDEPWRRYDRMLATGEIVIGEGGPPVAHVREVDATDEARELAESQGIDLGSVQGTGKDGRILKGDVEALVADEEA